MSNQMLTKPEAGQTAQCVVQHGHVYALGFDTSHVEFGRSEGDLLMSFEDGASIILRDFYNESQIGDFFLQLADGNVVSARSVVESMDYVLDDFVTQGNAVYTAESYSSAQDGMGAVSLVPLFCEENELLLLQPQDALSGPDSFSGQDSLAVQSGAFVPADQSGSAEIFAAPKCDEGSSLDIITPRVLPEGGASPFLAQGDVSFEDGTGESLSAQVFSFTKNAKNSDLLLLEDLLDTTMPEEVVTGKESVPAFEELFASGQDDGFVVRIEPLSYTDMDAMNTMSASNASADGSDQLLLAFLRMGSF